MSADFAEIELLAVRASPKTVWSFVRVTDGDGRVGWGEATLAGQEQALAVAHARIAPILRRTNADPCRELLADLRVAAGDRAGAAMVSAIDQAVWDIEGKRQGKPVHALLEARAPAAVGLYANINRRTTCRTPEGFADSARKALADGFSTVKIAPFDLVRPGSAAGIEEGVACAAAVREAIGPARRLYVDCHWRFDETTALAAIAALARHAVAWFECPLPEIPANFDALGRLRRAANASGMVLAGCESETGTAGFRPFLERDIYDVLMPDVKYAGGFAEFRRIAAEAAARGIAVAPHNPSGPISHFASIQISAGLTGFTTLEHQYDESQHFFDIVDGAVPRPVDGMCPVPVAPGLGAALDRTALLPLKELVADPVGVAR